jgi:hypothetical protein
MMMARWRTCNEATMSAASKALMNIVQLSLASVGKLENLKILVAKGNFKIGKMTTRAAKNVILYNIPNVRGSYSTFSF